MIRFISTLAIAASLAGAAHAQGSQQVVQTAGKSAPAARAELYRAAQDVCTSAAVNSWDSVCVEETYTDALRRLHVAPAARQTASLQTVAFSQR